MNRMIIVRKEDNRNAIIATILYVILVLFLLFFLTYSIPDPPKMTTTVPIVMEDTGITNFEVDYGGGGSPEQTVTPVTKPVEQPKEQPTQKEESPVEVPPGTNKTDNSNAPSQSNTSSNPFSGSGSGGTGTSGTGTGFGSDTGPGSGTGNPGQGMAGDRKRLTNMTSKPSTHNNEVVQIALKLWVNASGRVVRADVIRNNTTTTNQALIDEVIKLVKREVTYAAKSAATADEIAFYTITVKPNG